MVVVEDGGRDYVGVGNLGLERRVCATGSGVEYFGDAVVADEVVRDEGGGFGADTVRTGSAVFAGGSDEKVVSLIVGSDDRLCGERFGSQGIEKSLRFGLHGDVEGEHSEREGVGWKGCWILLLN